MSDVPVEVQAQIIQAKIQIWLNTEYDAQLDAEIAQVLDDAQMKAAAVKRMKDAKKAIAELTRKLGGLPTPTDPEDSDDGQDSSD